MEQRVEIDGIALAVHYARPATTAAVPALVLCHDFPTPPRDRSRPGSPSRSSRTASPGTSAGWSSPSTSAGPADPKATSRSTAGSRTSGTRSTCCRHARTCPGCGSRERVQAGRSRSALRRRTSACAASRRSARRRCCAGGRRPASSTTAGAWACCARRARRRTRPPGPARSRRSTRSRRQRKLAPRPLLVLHGSDDDVAPIDDARILAEAHGAAELRVVLTAGRRIRHDPRAIASLVGWLDRQAG